MIRRTRQQREEWRRELLRQWEVNRRRHKEELTTLIGLFVEDTYDHPVSYPLPPQVHPSAEFPATLPPSIPGPKTSYKHIPYIFFMVFFFFLCTWNASMLLIGEENARAGYPPTFQSNILHLAIFVISLFVFIGIFLTGRWTKDSDNNGE
jgi:hypothetical protein